MISDLIGKEIDGKYRLVSLVRETELGDFYRAIIIGTGAPVTMKILAPAMAIDNRYVERFFEDTKPGRTINHPNILNNIDVGSDPQGIPYAVYECIQGEFLSDTLKRMGPFPASRAVGIARQIASAIEASHGSAVVHAGLDPKKVIIENDGIGDFVRVFDFGARSHAANSMESVQYLSPEQCSSSPAADTRSDIYTLGVLLFEMLSGKTPFAGATPFEVISGKTNGETPRLPGPGLDLHPQLEPIIQTAMAMDPDARYQTMSDFEVDLSRIATEIGAYIPDLSSKAVAVGSKRNVWQTTLIVLMGVGVLTSALIWGTYTKQTNPTVSLVPDADSLPVQPINPATGAQEDSLTKLGDLGDAALVGNEGMELPPGTLPGGDGFNAWANGGVPPAGAPLAGSMIPGSPLYGAPPPQYIPPGGQTITIDPNGGSQFMPNDGGVILVPIPADPNPQERPAPTPKTPPANAAVKPADPKGTTPPANTSSTKPSVKRPADTKPSNEEPPQF